jgi:phosphoketolase
VSRITTALRIKIPASLFELTGFHGWEAGALWDEIKLDIRHFADIERLAVVGDKKWEHGMVTQNDLDRFHLVQDVVDRLPHLGTKGAYLKQQMQDKLIEHKHYIDQRGAGSEVRLRR